MPYTFFFTLFISVGFFFVHSVSASANSTNSANSTKKTSSYIIQPPPESKIYQGKYVNICYALKGPHAPAMAMKHPFFFDLIDQSVKSVQSFFEDSLQFAPPSYTERCPYYNRATEKGKLAISLVDLGTLDTPLREKNALAQIARVDDQLTNSLYFENDFKRGAPLKEIIVPISDDEHLNLHQNPLLPVQNILVHELFHIYYRQIDPDLICTPYVESLAAWMQNRFDQVGLTYPFFKNWQNTPKEPPFSPLYPGYRDFMIWGALEEAQGLAFLPPLLKRLSQDPALCKDPYLFAPIKELLKNSLRD